jgi:Tol biopolymer transport system component
MASGGPANSDDAGPDEGPGLGAARPDAAPVFCEDALAFGPPVLLAGLPEPPLFGPALSVDGRTLYFASNGDLFSASRTNTAETTFGSASPIVGANGGLPELTPHVSRDGLSLYFARDVDGSGFFRDLMRSERGSRDDTFGTPSALSALNDPLWSELSPTLRPDGLELFFASSRPGGPGLFDIWQARRTNPGAVFSNPQPVPEINSAADESGITFTRDGAAILSSSRDGSLGGRDLWLARRSPQTDGFAVTTNIAALNTAENDTDPALRFDEGELVFASDRSGQSLLYSASRLCTP